MPVLRHGGTDACPQCQGLSCFLCLTAPPTAYSYITPAPFPGPLPVFNGLFLSFSALAFSPHWLLLSPLPSPQPHHPLRMNAMNARLDIFSTVFLCLLYTICIIQKGSFERTGFNRAVYPLMLLFPHYYSYMSHNAFKKHISSSRYYFVVL